LLTYGKKRNQLYDLEGKNFLPKKARKKHKKQDGEKE
jgi:hypothetical protein